MCPNVSHLSLLGEHLSEWRMAGQGSFVRLDEDAVESRGGPGLFWYPAQAFGNFVLEIDWRIHDIMDNSGVLIRCPELGAGTTEDDWRPAVTHGYEVQIDDRGYDPAARKAGSALHVTGAVYRLAPARVRASRPVGSWNSFTVIANGADLRVTLNDVEVAHLEQDLGRRRHGYIALQSHHEGSRVQFRRLRVTPLG